MSDILGVILLFFLVLLNAFFVAAEFAIVKVRGTRVGEPALAHLIEPPLDRIGLASPITLHASSAILAFAVITFLHIVIGELAPKSVAIRKAEATALWVALPLRWFYLIFLSLIHISEPTSPY